MAPHPEDGDGRGRANGVGSIALILARVFCYLEVQDAQLSVILLVGDEEAPSAIGNILLRARKREKAQSESVTLFSTLRTLAGVREQCLAPPLSQELGGFTPDFSPLSTTTSRQASEEPECPAPGSGASPTSMSKWRPCAIDLEGPTPHRSRNCRYQVSNCNRKGMEEEGCGLHTSHAW